MNKSRKIYITHTAKSNVTAEKISNKKALNSAFAVVVLAFVICTYFTWWYWLGESWLETVFDLAELIAIFATLVIIYNTYTTLRRWSKQG